MDRAISVLGLGNMGSVLARLFIEHGHPTVVWNRTAAKAEPLAELGARVAPDVASAVQASSVVVACVERYDQVDSMLEQADRYGVLRGRTIVNLTSGTASQAREMQDWVIGRGAQYLDGALNDYPETMGTAEALIRYAGARSTFDATEQLLAAIARPVYEGSDAALPNIMNSAGTAFFASALGGFYESIAYAREFGIEPRTMLNLITDVVLDLSVRSFAAGVDQIEGGDHRTDQASVRVFLDACRMVRADMTEIGIRDGMVAAFCDVLESAEAAGHGQLALSALADHLNPLTRA